MDETNGRDGESFHRDEAISAVADDPFLGEEDDDDYDDLYNDVNVGDGFLQSVKKNESLPDPEPENVPKGVESVPESVSDRARKFGDDGNGGNEGLGRVVASEGVGLGSGLGNMANKGDLGQFSVKVNEGENRSMGNMNGMSNMNSNDNGMGIVGPGPQQNYHNAGNMGNVGGGGGTILFVGDLHWWTTDAELEAELCKYGHVKEVKFFDEKASGKSKGYCQVEFYDSAAAAACKEGMNGHVFNGRPCVVAFASPFSVKRMGEAQVNRTQQTAQPGQIKRGPGGPVEGPVKPGVPGGGNNMNMAPGANFQGSGDNNRGYGRANWGRNNGGGMMGRARPMGGRARPMMGNGYGPPPMMHPQSMMGQGFDPSFNGPMNRMGNYGFPGGPTPPFSGMMPSFPPVGNVGVPGLAPHVNPAFFGRGMPMNGMGMMQSGGPDGPNMGMWSDPNMPGWAGDEHGGRVGESSYGEEAGSDQQYGEGKEKERDWSGTSDRRVRDDRDDREQGYERDIPREKETVHEEEWPEKRHRDRDRERERERERERSRDRDRDRERSRDHHRYREEKDRYADHHRHRDAEPEYDEEWDRSRSSRTHGKSRTSHKDEHRSRSKESDYGKRRRVTAE